MRNIAFRHSQSQSRNGDSGVSRGGSYKHVGPGKACDKILLVPNFPCAYLPADHYWSFRISMSFAEGMFHGDDYDVGHVTQNMFGTPGLSQGAGIQTNTLHNSFASGSAGSTDTSSLPLTKKALQKLMKRGSDASTASSGSTGPKGLKQRAGDRGFEV